MCRLSVLVAVLVAGPLIPGAVRPAFGHGTEQVGAYSVVLGWVNEPAYVEQPNAIHVIVRDGGGRGVEGLTPDLRAEARFGERTTGPLELAPMFGRPGEYRAELIPTSPGRYTFQVTGAILGQQLDIQMSAGENTFDEVQEPRELQFPAPVPSGSAQAERLERLNGRLVALQADLDAATNAARTGMIAALVGVLVAAAALALATVARRRV